MIKIIASVSKNGVIGNANSLIWDLPNDMKRFRNLTLNNTVVMGRKTYESIGKPLELRRNIIITNKEDYYVDNCEVVNSLEEALMLCNNNCFIIGGGEIYKQSINMADELYITLIDEDFEGDTYFPEIGSEWCKIDSVTFNPDGKNKYKHTFIDYEKYEF